MEQLAGAQGWRPEWERPNAVQTWEQLVDAVGGQLAECGMALIWAVPNRFNAPSEAHCVPTYNMVPQAVYDPQYPQGCYHFSALPGKVPPMCIIPAQHVIKLHGPVESAEKLVRTLRRRLEHGMLTSAVLHMPDCKLEPWGAPTWVGEHENGATGHGISAQGGRTA